MANDRFGGNLVGAVNRMRTTPIPVQRTVRRKMDRVLTSMNAGFMTPIMATPLLREDSASGNYRIAFEMEETVEVLMNAVNVRVLTYLVPKLALERFNGLDELNRSYEGITTTANGGTVPPWFSKYTIPAGGVPDLLKKMGKHARIGQEVNDDYIQAYNCIWNFRAKNRSKDLALRAANDLTLAPAFWTHQTFAHIVPDFDQAVIDGAVPLTVTSSGKLPVSGLGVNAAKTAEAGGTNNVRDSTSPNPQSWGFHYSDTSGGGNDEFFMRAKATGSSQPDVYAIFDELSASGVSISLANIELARKTQAFANLRRMYQGHSDEYIIDLLMDGISIPDEFFKQPILLSDVSTVIGMSKRYATDGASLTESVVNGLTAVDVRWNCPRVGTSGVIMTVVEIAPEQLFERQVDPYLHATTVDELPSFLRDTLDPEKVVVVKNEEIDVDHATPDDTFGYAPLNWQWAKSIPQIGGKFHRSNVGQGFDEDRQRVWAVETANPTLSKDFYLVSGMHYKPFVITDVNIDHFEVLARGEAVIRGNTVFGGLLVEAADDYEKVLAKAPMDRIDKPVTTDTDGEPDA